MTNVRRYDPDRRGRIIDAALDVIAEVGVAGASHRVIAKKADVPLGSMTYHFESFDQLMEEAFRKLSFEVSQRYIDELESARSIEDAREVVVQLISGGIWATERNMSLQFELYAYMARHKDLRAVVRDWMGRSREAFGKHFDTETAAALDAFLEGVTIHNFAHANAMSIEVVREMVARLTRS